MLAQLEKTMNIQLLRYSAGHHITCKYCSNIMDYRKTVIVDVIDDARNESLYINVSCATCYDKLIKPNIDTDRIDESLASKGIKARIDVVDGRDYK